ncbi:chromatin target of prmt1 protein-like isoform x1 [Plakobranchus ocellatus]|uniref:Chromatin target of prmt1 protein-like isoform x1 n=1 Tax=Plakobranchus ocellatus TaxID=259542 RepID=A0AAV4DAL1_9GAST|nr:chromatin target of prmt1 protein-like isoform x1 [Plakobranchus ocellatus]
MLDNRTSSGSSSSSSNSSNTINNGSCEAVLPAHCPALLSPTLQLAVFRHKKHHRHLVASCSERRGVCRASATSIMTTVPTKIVLKSTTRMSLSDRFSAIVPTVQNIRANMAAEQQVSAANRRLAQQLANRPGVYQSGGGSNAVSLMYQQQQQMMMGSQQSRGGGLRGGRGAVVNKGNLNLKQRLGKSNIKNRLTLPGGRGAQFVRGGGRGRGGRGRGGGGGGGSSNTNQGLAIQGGAGDYSYSKPRGRGGFSPMRARGRGGSFRGRGSFNRFEENFRDGRGGPRKNRGGLREKPGFTGQTIVRGGGGGGGRGQRRGGRGMQRGRGRGGRGGSSNPSVTAQALDSQLDEYMSKTKSHLDSQLDAYMSEVA